MRVNELLGSGILPLGLVPVLLAAVAVLYSMVLPLALAGRHQLRRTPVSTLVLWQSLALGGVLAAISGGALAVVIWLRPESGAWSVVGSVLAGGVAAVVLIRLMISGHLVGRRLRDIRARHRDLVDLLGKSPGAGWEADIRVIESVLPVAYCLPGWGGSRIVLAQSALEQLNEEQLQAVLIHERKHLESRHDLVVEGFSVLNRAFPQIKSGAMAQREVEILVEIIADRAACRVVPTRVLVEAIGQLGAVSSAEDDLGHSTSAISERLDTMLAGPSRPTWQASVVALLAGLVLLLPSGLLAWSLLG